MGDGDACLHLGLLVRQTTALLGEVTLPCTLV